MTWTPIDGERKREKPTRTWRRKFKNELTQLLISYQETQEVATGRKKWRQISAQNALDGSGGSKLKVK